MIFLTELLKSEGPSLNVGGTCFIGWIFYWMKRKGKTEYKHSLLPGKLKFRCPDFPSVMDYDLELWSRKNPSSPKLPR